MKTNSLIGSTRVKTKLFHTLNLRTADDVAAFFRDKCSKIQHLSVSPLPSELLTEAVVISAKKLSKDFPNLRSLIFQLNECGFTSSLEIEKLELQDLQMLTVASTPDQDQIYEFKCHLTKEISKLNELNLKNVFKLELIAGKGCKLSSDFHIVSSSVETLNLENLTIENKDLCSRLPALRNLVANNCRGVSTLNFSRNLEGLFLYSCQEKELYLNRLKVKLFNASGIQNIHISDCPELTSIELTTPKTMIINSCPNIGRFHCTDARLLQDFSFLNNCPSLRVLGLECIKKLPPAVPLNILRKLIVSSCITDFSFLNNCEKLKKLWINECDLIQNGQLGMDFVALIPSSLEELRISKQLFLSDEVLQALQKKVQQLFID